MEQSEHMLTCFLVSAVKLIRQIIIVFQLISFSFNPVCLDKTEEKKTTHKQTNNNNINQTQQNKQQTENIPPPPPHTHTCSKPTQT